MNFYPSASERPWGGRLALIDPDAFDDDQRSLDRELRAKVIPWANQSGFASTTDDGRFIGPMNIYLRRPQLSRAYLEWISAEQQESSLPARIREVVILTIAVSWQVEFIIYSHVAIARNVGLPKSVIDGILTEKLNQEFSNEEAVSYRFTTELTEQRKVSDDTYRAITELFGEQGVIDMTNLAGIYLTASALQNVFEVPAPSA
jgi:4-carboxymuconolactone decarboxylase